MEDTPSTGRRRATPVDRRRFLTGLGVGTAGAVAVGPARAVAGVVEGDHAAGQIAATTPADRFGRIFQLPSFAPANDRVRAALSNFARPGGPMDANDNLAAGPIQLIIDPTLSVNNRDNPFQTAGTTFFGQFLDHDMTFDTTSPLGQPTDPASTVNVRTPALDLDSVYGRGRTIDPQLYDPADGAKLRVGFGGLFEDLPRGDGDVAIIGDPRNDENVIIAGFHTAILLLHNRVVDLLRSQGVPAAEVFDRARQLVTWHYQWLVVNEFLPQIIGFGMTQSVLHHGRRHYRPEPGPAFIPVEFQGAAYRFGHSMVRPSYRANLAGNADRSAFFGMIFDPAGQGQADPVDLRGGRRARRRFIGWQTFFNFGDGQVRTNKRIDTKISTPLFRLPLSAIAGGAPPISLPQRNLLRHLTWQIPSGQRIAAEMGVPTLQPSQFPELAGYGLGLEANTPLWYYVLKEAELLVDGIHLGPTGGRIVGEVFIGVLQLDPRSYLAVQPNWQPTLPSQIPGRFQMTDLLRFARVDPASRRQ